MRQREEDDGLPLWIWSIWVGFVVTGAMTLVCAGIYEAVFKVDLELEKETTGILLLYPIATAVSIITYRFLKNKKTKDVSKLGSVDKAGV